MIRLQASILVTWRHGRLFDALLEADLTVSRFDCDLLILDTSSFNGQMMNQALTVQSVILLMKSFGILLHMSSEVHSHGVFSKHSIMNEACEQSWIKSQLKLRWVFSFFLCRYSELNMVTF